MDKKIAMVVFGLVMLCVSQGWAGTSGNGWVTAGLPSEGAKTRYAFCYAGNPRVVYLSQIITVAPTESAPKLNAAYGKYIMTAYGLPGFDRQRCVTANSIADAAAEKQRYKGMMDTKSLIEIEWDGTKST